MFKKSISLILLFLFLFLASLAFAKETYIPPSLSEWTKWIMHGREDQLCPSAFNNHDSRECLWPGTLEITVDDTGATFTQTWTVTAEGFVPVPGDSEIWPQNLVANSSKVAATIQNESPSVLLKPGEYIISGSFRWFEIPQRIKIPDTTAIVSLKINGNNEKTPVVDDSGFLWLSRQTVKTDTEAPENRMDVKISRMIDDVYPLEITTIIQLGISGETRRESLSSGTLPAGTFPAAVTSQVPVKIDEKGIIRFEARPGTWDISIKSIMEKIPENTIKAECPYGAEAWAFRSHPELRNVRIEGADTIDPTQTTMPEEWRQFSSYLLKKDEKITLNEIRRGSGSQTESDLTLFRDLWLDFDGKGAVTRDQIGGNLERRIFLGLEKKNYLLGRVTSDGTDQLITELDGNLGTEMEKGSLDMTAVSRIEKMSSATMFPVGWNTRFQKAEGNIHIPPGWRLLGICGGTVPDRSTWIDRWSLLDVFIVMIISVAVAKLWGIIWGLVFFAGLALIAHEPFAPKSLWILITITAAVSVVIEKSGIKSEKAEFAVRIAHIIACILIAGSGIMFCYTQIRLAIYPQLEKPWMTGQMKHDAIPAAHREMKKPKMLAKSAPMSAPVAEAPAPATEKEDKEMMVQNDSVMAEPYAGSSEQSRFDYSVEPLEKAITQTGPGLPEWNWTTVPVKFGLAGETHTFSLWLSPPLANTIAGFVRVFLFLVLASRFININISGISGVFRRGTKIPQIAVLTAITVLAPLYHSSASDIPGQEMLNELEKRILEPAPCYPECASSPYLKIIMSNDSKTAVIEMDVDAAIKTAVPVPAGNGTWEITTASINRNISPGIIKRDGFNWILVPEGSSRIIINAAVKSSSNLKFTFPIKPMFVEIKAEGWVPAGLDENQQVQTELILSRKSGNKEKSAEDGFSESASSLKGYMKVERIISLGIEWKAVTRVSRLHETGGPDAVSADIPLINGEIVHNSKIKAKNGIARVEIGAGENRIEWASSIPVSDEIKMQIPENASWGEIWHVNASSIWHLSSSGVPEVHSDGIPGTFWYPHQGETVSIKAKRLEGAEGDSTTIDAVNVDYHAGKEFSRMVLDTRIRTSQGGILPVRTPSGTTLKTVRINGITVPLAESSGKINIPLQPGNQNLNIEWTEKPGNENFMAKAFVPKILKAPETDLGRPSSNIDINIHTPEKIWILFTSGPRMGPAVLFWGYLIIVIIGAILLGRFAPIPIKTTDWLLLGIGLAPLGPGSIIFTVMWFAAVHIRGKKQPEKNMFFRLVQIMLLVSTFIMAGILYSAVKNGLLGIPDMQISGNGSSEAILKWTMDRSGEILPRPFAVTVSIYVFRLLMFAWAAWLAFRVVEWSKWAYSAFRQNGLWQKS